MIMVLLTKKEILLYFNPVPKYQTFDICNINSLIKDFETKLYLNETENNNLYNTERIITKLNIRKQKLENIISKSRKIYD